MAKGNKIGKQLIEIVCATLVLTSCSDNSYKGYSGLIVEPSEEGIPVMISVGNPDFDNTLTRGSGAIDQNDNDSWHDAFLYVYSFKRDLSIDYSVKSTEGNETCLIDGSTDEQNSKLGRKAKINEYETYISWVNDSKNVFYHANNLPYDFFGYYIDDLEIGENDVLRTKEGIQLKVKIDGTQDLMSTRASLTEEQANRKGFSDEEITNIKDWYYSFYTAQRNIHPVMVFKHHLSRLIFQIYPAYSHANNVIVDEIRVSSKKEGLFTVVHSATGNMGVDFSGDQPYEDFLLREKKGEPLLKDTYHTDYHGDFSEPVYDRPHVRIGESLMLPPGETKYNCIVRLKEKKDGKEYTYEGGVILTSGSDTFKPGMQYIVKLAIYGLQEIGVSVAPTPWEDGGDVTVDPDKDFNTDY